jgi:hypothetical protein
MNVQQLTPSDILIAKQDDDQPQRGYVVRKQWFKPVNIPNQTFPYFKLIGFTLFDTLKFIDKEVSVEELQDSLDNETLIPFYPETVRRVKGLTPRGYHA